MSQTINGNMSLASIPTWIMNSLQPPSQSSSAQQSLTQSTTFGTPATFNDLQIVQSIDSFESEIGNKIGPYPHYPGPIHNIGGLHVGSHCRIPGVQPFMQSILRPQTCIPYCLTKHCYEYGNTRFPPNCECNDKYDCRAYGKCYHNSRCKLKESFNDSCQPYETSTQEACKMAGWTNLSCGGNCSPTCGTCNHNSNVINY
jgi:hypothetical protein